ncbi:hypothetical protein GDO81_016086 [Engystomops pustulosus]|uniref:FAM65 N-terminal domain-containing protein n=1 Tax=Engystomops pustulosus TaxID=76066 RepID=A0AAV7AQK4_ENGPU|nr:hypothetical protein GDO81_016086 [Engystomops pustulosus]
MENNEVPCKHMNSMLLQVTELKSLANHVIVGSVSCETKDLFAALPQVVAVDINDLGTIKLNLEVNWNPFDKEDQPSAASTVNKTSTVNKRFSTYNPSPPDTPSLREQAFYNMLRRQEDMENGAAWSISSESSDDSSSPQLSNSARHAPKNIVQPELQASAPDIEISFTQREEALSTGVDTEIQEGEKDEKMGNESMVSTKESVTNNQVIYSRTLSHISEVSFDAAGSDFHDLDELQIPLLLDASTAETIDVPAICEKADNLQTTIQPACVQEEVNEMLEVNLKTDLQQRTTEPVQSPDTQEQGVVTCTEEPEHLFHVTGRQQPALHCSSINATCLDVVYEETETPTFDLVNSDSVKRKIVDSGLNEAISSLSSSLDDYRGQFPELQTLENKIKHLEELFMQKQGVFRSRASSMSLTVENALESFDFLNTTSDMEDSECSEEEGVPNERIGSGEDVPAGTQEQKKTKIEDIVCCSSETLSNLTTGSEQLDRALVIHLYNCNRLLLHLGTFGPLRCRELYALDKLMREVQILEIICRLTEEKSGRIQSAAEVLTFSASKEGIVEFWNECVQPSDIYVSLVETVLQSLNKRYAEQINLQHEGLSDAGECTWHCITWTVFLQWLCTFFC